MDWRVHGCRSCCCCPCRHRHCCSGLAFPTILPKFFFQTFTIPNFGPARPVLPPWIWISPDCRLGPGKLHLWRKKVPRSIPVAATIQHRRHFRPYVAKPAEKPGALPSNPIWPNHLQHELGLGSMWTILGFAIFLLTSFSFIPCERKQCRQSWSTSKVAQRPLALPPLRHLPHLWPACWPAIETSARWLFMIM